MNSSEIQIGQTINLSDIQQDISFVERVDKLNPWTGPVTHINILDTAEPGRIVIVHGGNAAKRYSNFDKSQLQPQMIVVAKFKPKA